MKRHFAGAIATAALLVCPANAADLPVKARLSAVASYGWTGFYIGPNCGGAWAHTTTQNTPPFGGFDNDELSVFELRASGFTCGAQAGYNWQSGAWVYGLEGDFGALGIDHSGFVALNSNELDFVGV